MLHYKLTKSFKTAAAIALAVAATACSDDIDSPKGPAENAIPGQEVGIRSLKVSIPRLSRFDKVVEHVSCRIHLRGRNDRVTYPVNSFISADKDSIYVEGDDPILSELPHQMYHLNAVTFPAKSMTTRDDSSVPEDTVYVGARLSIEDPDNIGFRSSFNVGSNSIGSGTETDPWIVASGEDFLTRVCDPMTRGDSHEGKFFEISRNLNLAIASVAYGKGWEPAGHHNANGGSTDFNGTINGCDNYIENLYCYSDGSYGGLFYRLGEKAYIHNVGIRNAMIMGESCLGTVASLSKHGCRLDSIEVSGSIEGTDYIGGIIGNGDADMRVCISSVDLDHVDSGAGNYKYYGGMIGCTSRSSFTDCVRTGRIDAPYNRVGGFVGGTLDDDEESLITLTRCYSSGKISGEKYVGGFVGRANVEFTDCHAGSTLPMMSYGYSLNWDLFGVNDRRSAAPLEVKGWDDVAGFVGKSEHLVLHGGNSFDYYCPAKPNIEGGDYTGTLAGDCEFYCDSDASFTSAAYVKGELYTGGIVGYGKFHNAVSFVNLGNVVGDRYTGGLVGYVKDYDDRADVATGPVNGINRGNVKGRYDVGGVIGYLEGNNLPSRFHLQNFGNVEGKEDEVGGLIGSLISNYLVLDAESCVGSENGSLKVTGRSFVGGLCGNGYLTFGDSNENVTYCPVYANIISSGEKTGGIFGRLKIGNTGKYQEVFSSHSPVRVSITAKGGDHVGGAIGYFLAWDDAVINGFDERLQVSISSSGDYVGGIVGSVYQDGGAVKIYDCHSFANITGASTAELSKYGGIVGYMDDTTDNTHQNLEVERCSFHGSIGGSALFAAGGIVGSCDDYLYVKECYNAGKVDAHKSSGGIVGRVNREGTITQCFNMGEVVSGNGRTWVAGILGQKVSGNDHRVTLSECYNVGKTGWGIIGGEDSNCSFSCNNCYYLDSASNGDMSGSNTYKKNADEMRRQSTYGGFATDGTWQFHEGVAAPTLTNVRMFNGILPLQK